LSTSLKKIIELLKKIIENTKKPEWIVVLLEQLRVHAGERARLLHLEEGARGRPDEVLR
jgi:hypothetical protein